MTQDKFGYESNSSIEVTFPQYLMQGVILILAALTVSLPAILLLALELGILDGKVGTDSNRPVLEAPESESN